MQFPEGPKEEVKTTLSAKFFDELIDPIRQVLEKHGATLEVCNDTCILHFPAGTMKQVLYPITQLDRYTITLPDGYELFESTSFSGKNIVMFALDEFPEWVQQKYGKKE